MKHGKLAIAIALTAMAPLHTAFAQSGQQQAQQVTPDVIGTPLKQRWPDAIYARNIWTMQVFGDRLYLGAGNSANGGPSSNSGPVPIVSYDGDKFTEEYTVAEEQITHFYQAGNTLLVPGHDSREDWSYGNLYRRAGGTWTKLRNIPHGIHVYDIRQFGGRLVAVGGAFDQPISAWISDDNAQSWKTAALLANPALADSIIPATKTQTILGHQSELVGRFYTLFEIGNTLYASASAALRSGPDHAQLQIGSLFRFDSAQNGFQPLAFGHSSKLFPDTPAKDGQVGLIQRWAKLGGTTIYIGGWQHNDHQWLPIGLYGASSLDNARRIPLASGEQPWDVFVKDGRFYCLSAKAEGNDQYRISVTRFDRDLKDGTVVTTFVAPTFARSFAEFRGRLYFGLGTETDIGVPLSEATGTILSTPFIP